MENRQGYSRRHIQKTAFILEEGTYKTVYQFDPQTVVGNLDLDPQARQYPARLTGQLVKFQLDENNVVTVVGHSHIPRIHS